MELIDTHSHVDMPEFDNIEEVIAKAKENGIQKIIIPSCDRNSFENVINLSNKYDELYCALGIHPTEFKEICDDDFDKIKELSSNKKVVGIGECGLDYYWDKSSERVAAQKEVFLRQIKLANELKLPLLVHDRDAHKDSFELLKANVSKEVPVIMHCFSGSVEFAKECLKEGYYIALGGVVTFKNAKKTKEVAKIVPLDRLLLETDAPYMAPVPFRGTRNEPAYVRVVAEFIAELRGVSVDEIAQATTENAKRIFGF